MNLIQRIRRRNLLECSHTLFWRHLDCSWKKNVASWW